MKTDDPPHPRNDCYFCGARGHLERHHILPDRYGGPDHAENYVDICHECHWKLERLYDDSFFEMFGIEKGDHPPLFNFGKDKLKYAEFDSPRFHEPETCAECERYGPFTAWTLQPLGVPVVECTRCGTLHIEQADEVVSP